MPVNAGTIHGSINPSMELAKSEALVDMYQGVMTDLETVMDGMLGVDEEMSTDIAEVRAEINGVRAALGFWRGEVSFWREQINEDKQAIKESNKLASSG